MILLDPREEWKSQGSRSRTVGTPACGLCPSAPAPGGGLCPLFVMLPSHGKVLQLLCHQDSSRPRSGGMSHTL